MSIVSVAEKDCTCPRERSRCFPRFRCRPLLPPQLLVSFTFDTMHIRTPCHVSRMCPMTCAALYSVAPSFQAWSLSVSPPFHPQHRSILPSPANSSRLALGTKVWTAWERATAGFCTRCHRPRLLVTPRHRLSLQRSSIRQLNPWLPPPLLTKKAKLAVHPLPPRYQQEQHKQEGQQQQQHL